VELVVGCLEHLFYVTYQLTDKSKILNKWAKEGKLPSQTRHILSRVFPQFNEAICKPSVKGRKAYLVWKRVMVGAV
jgi:hypothetical protein